MAKAKKKRRKSKLKSVVRKKCKGKGKRKRCHFERKVCRKVTGKKKRTCSWVKSKKPKQQRGKVASSRLKHLRALRLPKDGCRIVSTSVGNYRVCSTPVLA